MNLHAAHTVDLLTVVGARPQFIKSAALTRALPMAGISQHLVHTGQHPDSIMGLNFLEELQVGEPDAMLQPRQDSRSFRLSDMLMGISTEIDRVRPKAVLVYGDTDSTLAGALAAHHAGIPLLHVEAGLRSGDRSMPEEHNRIMTDQLSDWLFTTGPGASLQLEKEGVDHSRIVETGDVMLDVALAARSLLSERIPPRWGFEGPVLVVTLHRPGLVDNPVLLQGALAALGNWRASNGGHVYFPVHPRTERIMKEAGLSLPAGVVDPGPIGYLDMQAALHRASVVLTDSGGVQKEAWYQGAPAVVLRDNTEWTALLELDTCTLFSPGKLMSPEGQGQLVKTLENWSGRAIKTVEEAGLFGGGGAAARIVRTLHGILQ